MKKSNKGFKNIMIGIVSAIAAVFLVKTYLIAKLLILELLFLFQTSKEHFVAVIKQLKSF